MTTRAASAEILFREQLAGFWQFRAGGAHYLGIFETADDRDTGTLSAARLVDGRLQGLRPYASTDQTVRAAAACTHADDLVHALELNGVVPAQLTRIPLTSVVSPADPPDQAAGGQVALSASQVAAVDLPVSEQWNVAAPLAPEAWVFSVEPVCGSPLGEAVANTADGRAALLARAPDTGAIPPLAPPAPAAQGPGRLIANAAQPQAWWRDGRTVIAFIRTADGYWPFSSLRRYSGRRVAISGSLAVDDGQAATVDLSRALEIGPVGAIAATMAADGTEWLFASRRDGATTTVFALVRRGAEWQVAQRWETDAPADRLAVSEDRDRWHAVLGEDTAEGWRLRYVALTR